MIVLQGYIEPLYEATKEHQVFLSVDEKEFVILHKGAGVDLIDLLGNYVEITGTKIPCSEEETSKEVIAVRSYTILEE